MFSARVECKMLFYKVAVDYICEMTLLCFKPVTSSYDVKLLNTVNHPFLRCTIDPLRVKNENPRTEQNVFVLSRLRLHQAPVMISQAEREITPAPLLPLLALHTRLI